MRSAMRVVLAVVLASTFAPAQTNSAKPAEEVWAIRAWNLIDGRADQPLHDRAIIIRGNRIAEVIDASALPGRNIARVVNFGPSVTVMPGMIESHTHIFLQGENPAKGGYDLEGYAPELDMPEGAQLADGPVEFRKDTREQLSHGADWIKVYMTHRSWVDKQGHLVSQPTLTVEELKAVVDEAHGWGKKVACHAYNGIGLQRALDGGCDSIEHGLELTDANIAQMVRQGTWYCATLSPYYYWWAPADTPQGKRDRERAAVHGPSFQKALKAGVKIVFGTDAGSFEWTDLNSPIAMEFPRMVELGMTPMQAIKSATSVPAVMLDMEGEIGVIAPGAYADIIAMAGDPSKDVNVLKNVSFVVKDGKVYKDEVKQEAR